MKRMTLSAAAFLAASAMTLVGWSDQARAAEVTLTFPHEAPETTIKGRTINLFAELVAEYSNGTMKIEVFPGAQLMPSPEETRAAIRGQVDIVAPQTSYFSSLDDAFDVYFQPLLFSGFEDAMDLVSGPFGRELLTRLERFGLVGLGTWHDGPGYFFVKGEPVATMSDVRGKRIRIFPSNPLEQGVRAMGAVPVSMPAADVFLSLQQGVVDGVITTPTYAGPVGWGEVLGGMTRMMMFMGGYGVVINKNTWDGLTEEQRDILTRAVREAERWNVEAALQNLEDSEKILEDAGVRLRDVTPEELAVWQDAMQSVYDAQSATVQELIEQVRGM